MPVPSTADLIRFVDHWKTRRIVVAGDFMLDRYVYGNAERLSPDAPVPVLAVERQEDKPGGAANVCLALRALRCSVACLGVVGQDETGTLLRKILRQNRCDVSGILALDDRPTTVKQSLVGLAQHRHPQKMFRVDTEVRRALDADALAALLKQAARLLKGADVLCLEDYNKGVLGPETCQALIALAKRMKVPVLVDPAAIADYGKYKGATCITPNRTEAGLATRINANKGDEPSLQAMARKLLDELGLESVVLTLDKQGALLQERGGKPVMVPTVARQVYDVTGAGDMVLAMLAAARANGADWPTAVDLANTAAGLEVERFGVVSIPLEEVLVSLLEKQHADLGKRRDLDQLVTEIAAYRSQGRRIVFTNGCFDILHAGHVSFLRQARQQGDLLVVGLNSDASIRKLKGAGRPVNHEADRVMVLGELQSVDYICVFSEDTPIKLIRAVRPDVLVKGSDYTRDKVVGGDWVEKHGGKVVLADLVAGRSTTNIIRKISGGG
ncbi:MAG: D-glycero-beta-D-manno-heptose 1-phosphate adenylyltransferase [Planctomycetota bacterium]|nr:D-glycero-beta-D-manno-heptose 1-phosphate adenylyltransferase [Planctomycetota bacterium]